MIVIVIVVIIVNIMAGQTSDHYWLWDFRLVLIVTFSVSTISFINTIMIVTTTTYDDCNRHRHHREHHDRANVGPLWDFRLVRHLVYQLCKPHRQVPSNASFTYLGDFCGKYFGRTVVAANITFFGQTWPVIIKLWRCKYHIIVNLKQVEQQRVSM